MYNKQRGVISREVKVFDIIEGVYVNRIEIELDNIREDFLKPMRVNPLKHFSINSDEILKI